MSSKDVVASFTVGGSIEEITEEAIVSHLLVPEKTSSRFSNLVVLFLQFPSKDCLIETSLVKSVVSR